MSDVVLSALMAAFILGTLAAVIVGMVVMVRRARRQLGRQPDKHRPSAAGSSISSDEIIDLHLALKDVKDLREITERIPA